MNAPELDAPVYSADLDAVLSFLPCLENATAEQIWSKQPKISVQGHSISLESGSYHPIINEFQRALYAHGLIRDYDWGSWQAYAVRYFKHPSLLRKSGMKTCIKLLTLHIRKDHFVDGHLGTMLLQGQISLILRRMGELARHIPACSPSDFCD